MILYIDGDQGKVQIFYSPFRDLYAGEVAEALHEQFATDEADKRNISVITTGLAAERTFWGCLNVSFYDPKRRAVRLKQAGRGGGGTVFRDKKLAAIVVRKSGWGPLSNDPADPRTLAQDRCQDAAGDLRARR